MPRTYSSRLVEKRSPAGRRDGLAASAARRRPGRGRRRRWRAMASVMRDDAGAVVVAEPRRRAPRRRRPARCLVLGSIGSPVEARRVSVDSSSRQSSARPASSSPASSIASASRWRGSASSSSSCRSSPRRPGAGLVGSATQPARRRGPVLATPAVASTGRGERGLDPVAGSPDDARGTTTAGRARRRAAAPTRDRATTAWPRAARTLSCSSSSRAQPAQLVGPARLEVGAASARSMHHAQVVGAGRLGLALVGQALQPVGPQRLEHA